MNLPPKILNSPQMINQKYLSFHQKYAKALHKNFQRKRNPKPSSQISLDTLTILPSEEIKKEIYDWFFNLDTATKLKVCSIHNKYLVKILNQLILLYFYDENATFIPTKDNIYFIKNITGGCEIEEETNLKILPIGNSDIYGEYQETSEMDFYPFLFIENKSEKVPMSPLQNHQKAMEKEFIDNLTFLSVDELNDTLTLKQYFLENHTQFQAMMENFTEGNIFKDWVEPEYDSNHKVYNFPLPQWIKKKEKLSLVQIIAVYFEQIIMLNYEFYYYNKKLYNLPCGNKLNDLLEKNLKLENFLISECGKDKKKFFDSLNFKDIQEGLYNDSEMEGEIKKIQELKNKIVNRYYGIDSRYEKKIHITDIMKDLIQKMKVSFMQSIPGFINLICFPGVNEVLRCGDFLFRRLYQHLLDLLSNKSAWDLMNDLEDSETSKQSKKHKKKKKKNSHTKKEELKEVCKENTEPQKEQVIMIKKVDSNTSPLKPQKIEIDSNINLIKESRDSNNHKIINNIKINCFQEENNQKEEIKVKLEDSEKPSKKNKKNKFFLFPITSKRKKKQLEQQSQIEKPSQKKKQSPKKVSPKAHNIHLPKTPSPKNSDKKLSIITHQITESIITSSTSTSPSVKSSSYYPSSTNLVQGSQYPYYPSQSYITAYYNILKNICLYIPSDNFFNKLSKEIADFNQQVSSNLSILKKHRKKYLILIEQYIMNCLSPNYNIEISHYGSYATGLSIESSDIDILVSYSSKMKDNIVNSSTIINELNNFFCDDKNKNTFDYILPIYTASVPVIKLQCDISKDIDKNELDRLCNSFSFDQDEILKVKFDITFYQTRKNLGQPNKINPPLYAVNFVKESLAIYPSIKSIILVLKRFFKIMKLNNSFKGGLSSYSLFLLIYSFMKKQKSSNEGRELYSVLEWYSYFNFAMYYIDPNNENTPYLISKDSNQNGQIVILDPFTKINVAKSSFRTEEIKFSFIKALNCLKCSSWKGEQFFENKNAILKEIFSIK